MLSIKRSACIQLTLSAVVPITFALGVGTPTKASADHLLPKHNLQCSDDFPCPPEMRRRVDFWIQVFKGWDKGKAILHDPNAPERVYMVIDTGQGCSRAVSKRIKANQKVIRTALDSLATNLTKKRKITNKRERHLLTLFPNAKPSTIRNASKRIRCQGGVRDSFVAGLKRFNQYSGMVDRVLAQNNLPEDIRYLPFVESSYNPDAYSKAGAAGLWQIMPATARGLGLELNATVDERLDPEAATRAAAKYFLDATRRLRKVSKEKDPNVNLEDINPFVITSYNYGINGMRRAIRQVSPVYMEVLNKYKSPSFQVAVKNFYASFLAARHVAINADQYFQTVTAAKPVNSKTVVLQNATSIQRVEKVFGVSQQDLKPLNQSLTRYIWNGWRLIPAGYRLQLPPNTPDIKEKAAKLTALKPEEAVPSGDRYTVRRGDTACGIARALRVNCSALIKANGLGKRAVIRVGQNLDIPRKEGAVAQLSDQSARKQSVEVVTVRRGDTACGIAEKAGVSCRELIRFNQLGRKAVIRVGQKLNVPLDAYVASSVPNLNADNQYIVRKGDVACVIAAKFSVSCKELRSLNKLNRRATIFPGQKLKIPGLVAPATTETASALAVAPENSPGDSGSVLKRVLEPAQPGGQLTNLLDTLPDLSVRVGSQGGSPVYFIYVEVDETLGYYADWLGVGSASSLRKNNRIVSDSQIQLGKRILLPKLTKNQVARFEQKRVDYHQVLSENLKEKYQLVGVEDYKIQPGDSLWTMSREKGFPLWLIYRLNPELRLSGLSTGSLIKLPKLREI